MGPASTSPPSTRSSTNSCRTLVFNQENQSEAFVEACDLSPVRLVPSSLCSDSGGRLDAENQLSNPLVPQDDRAWTKREREEVADLSYSERREELQREQSSFFLFGHDWSQDVCLSWLHFGAGTDNKVATRGGAETLPGVVDKIAEKYQHQ